MKILIKSLNLTVLLLLVFAGTSIASEWYESMESSGIDQSQSVLKNISTSGSITERQDVKQAIAEIAESVNKEAAQVAESAVRGQEASHPSEASHSSGAAISVDQEDAVVISVTGIGQGSAPHRV